MSVKVDLQRIAKKIKLKVSQYTSKPTMAAIAIEAIRLIKERTRKGFGVRRSGQSQYRFPALSQSYIEQRRRMRLSPFTSAAKSNVTRTGRLVGGIRASIREGRAIIAPTGNSREGTSNIKIAEYLLGQDRIFMNLSNTEIKKLKSFLKRRKTKT